MGQTPNGKQSQNPISYRALGIGKTVTESNRHRIRYPLYFNTNLGTYVRAPTHAGGLFAIDREWFKEVGWYDPGLWVWGGENFELSFKVLCSSNLSYRINICRLFRMK